MNLGEGDVSGTSDRDRSMMRLGSYALWELWPFLLERRHYLRTRGWGADSPAVYVCKRLIPTGTF
jgi:hypothetical protein